MRRSGLETHKRVDAQPEIRRIVSIFLELVVSIIITNPSDDPSP